MRPHTYFGKAAAGMLSVLSILALVSAGQAASAQSATILAPVKVGDGDWGDAKEGLRLGLFLENQGREFHYGDILTFALRAWNVGEKTFECNLHALPGNAPFTMTGSQLQLEGRFSGLRPISLIHLEVADIPGGTFKVCLLPAGAAAPPAAAAENAMSLSLVPGKYTVNYVRPLWIGVPDDPTSATIHPAKPNPITFTVLSEEAIERQTLSRDLPQPNVLWGDTVNGIQSGISYAPIDRLANTPTRRVVFQHWVRNMTDRQTEISYTVLGTGYWNGLVTDAAGNVSPVVSPLSMFSGFRAVRQATLNLKPGEPVVLQKSTLLLVQDAMKPTPGEYTPRMAVRPGVYDTVLTDTVRCPGVNMVCVTPKIRFTIPR